MGIKIRLPNITGQTEKEQLAQLKSYLYQLCEELQFAFDSISSGSSVSPGYVLPQNITYHTGASTVDVGASFSAIKSLIIKSADIVDAYYEEINRKLEGVYVAQSDFGDFVEKTSQEIEETSTSTIQRFENLQMIINDANGRIADIDENLQESKVVITESIQSVQDGVMGVNALLEDAKSQLNGSIDDLEIYVRGLQDIIGVSTYLKSGLLYYTDAGIPVYGLEIGQSVKDEVAGTEVFNKYARFTSEKLSFFDSNGIEVAYISDKKLYIRMAHITVSFQIGGLIDLVMANGDVVEKWVGMGG